MFLLHGGVRFHRTYGFNHIINIIFIVLYVAVFDYIEPTRLFLLRRVDKIDH